MAMKFAEMNSGYWICEACGAGVTFRRARCFMCGSYLEALQLLSCHGIVPEEIHNILGRYPDYWGISIAVAETVIEAYRVNHDEPH